MCWADRQAACRAAWVHVAGLRAKRGIGNLAVDPHNTLPLPQVSGPNKKYHNVCCADLEIIL